MSIAVSLNEYLIANATITAQLASNGAVFPEVLPQTHDGFPALVYSLVTDQDQIMLDGSANELKRANLQLDVYSRTFLEVNNVATVIKSELVAYRGAFGSHTAEHIRKANEFSNPPEFDTGLYRVSLEFEVAYF